MVADLLLSHCGGCGGRRAGPGCVRGASGRARGHGPGRPAVRISSHGGCCHPFTASSSASGFRPYLPNPQTSWVQLLGGGGLCAPNTSRLPPPLSAPQGHEDSVAEAHGSSEPGARVASLPALRAGACTDLGARQQLGAPFSGLWDFPSE